MNPELPELDRSALEEPLRTLVQARARLARATQLLERGRQVADQAKQIVDRHEQAQEAAERSHAEALERWIAAGEGEAPEMRDNRELAEEIIRSQSDLRSANRALASLQEQHDRAQADVAAADKELRSQMSKTLIDQMTAVATRVAELETEHLALREQLIGLIHAHEGRFGRLTLSEVHSRALHPQQPLTAEFLQTGNPYRARIAEIRERYTASIDALLSGDA